MTDMSMTIGPISMETKKIQFHDKTLLCEILIIFANVMNVYILTSETDNHHRGKIDILNRKCQSAHRKWIGAPAMQGRMLYAI